MSCKRPLSTLTSLNLKKDEKRQKIATFSNNPKNNLLTLNYGLPGSFITLST